MSQKKAVIVGGSNGIGLAIAKRMILEGYYVYILDMVEPEDSALEKAYYTYKSCNLLDLNESIFYELASDQTVEALMITAGIGRATDFQYLHPAEIEKLFEVNTIASIKIIRFFYERINSHIPFYCGIMGSIAGIVSSPLFSVYAASKAAIFRFVESINIELEIHGTANRVLNVSPVSIAGTRFNGGKNEPAKVNGLAGEIVEHLLHSAPLFIPKYEELCKEIIERYNNNPHEYGRYSYNYKMNSGRVVNKCCARVGYLSGTFDLFHVGHLNLLKRAKEQCDYLIVGIHDSGAWKGKETFIPLEERKQIVSACKYVDKVVDSCREDSDAWALYHYDKLFVGSDYKGTERFNRYEEYFKDKGVEIVYFPYTQSTSSTQIRRTVMLKTRELEG